MTKDQLDEIRKNAPGKATRYDDENWTAITYFKKENEKWFWFNETWRKWFEYDFLFCNEQDFLELTKPL